MRRPEDKHAYPLRPRRYCSGRIRHHRVSLFWRVAFLCILLLMVASVVHVLVGDHGVSPMRAIGHTVFFLVLLAVVAIAVLRRLFRPVKRLMQGVQALSDGNLDFRFQETGHGEFSRLAEAFDEMSSHIQDMLQSKTRLLLDVSHELRSPLTRIKIALEMSPDTPKKQSIMQDIAEMETMLTELLESESLKTGNGSLVCREIDLTHAIPELLEKYKTREPGVVLLRTPAQLPVYADSRRLLRATQNVLENALKYSQHTDKPVEVSLEKENGFAIIAVRDYGEGISEDEQNRIFEPFYRVDKSRNRKSGGFGLGLSLCSEIMRAHKGDIEVTSESGVGTQIRLLFPA